MEPTRLSPTDVFHPVSEGEGQLLGGRRTCLPDVVAGNRDCVPFRQVPGSVLDGIRDEAHRRLGGKDVLLLRDVLLENVVLGRTAQRPHRHALLLCRGDEHRPDDGRRAVDCHRRGHFVERNPVEENQHVGERADGHTALAELSLGLRGVGVIPHQRRQIEGDGQSRLPTVKKVAEAGVRLLGGPETREHTHRPQTAPIHCRMDAAGEWVLPRKLAGRIAWRCQIQRRVQPLDPLAGDRRELILTLRVEFERTSQRRAAPAPELSFQTLIPHPSPPHRGCERTCAARELTGRGSPSAPQLVLELGGNGLSLSPQHPLGELPDLARRI